MKAKQEKKSYHSASFAVIFLSGVLHCAVEKERKAA